MKANPITRNSISGVWYLKNINIIDTDCGSSLNSRQLNKLRNAEYHKYKFHKLAENG